ncbi:hypothetical protein HQ533_05045 [Candidatus Woesearchaeota archaeon]|nr:hypothetical protein [Candidatus Woesearchaeota archaeon]
MNKFNHLKKYDYRIWATRPSSIAREYVFMKHIAKHVDIFVTIPKEKPNATYYMDKDLFHKYSMKLLNNCVKNYKKHLKEYPKKRKNLIEPAKKLGKIARTASKKKLWKMCNKYIKTAEEFQDYIMLPFTLNENCETELIKVFKDKFKIIVQAETPTVYQRFEKMLLDKPLKKVAEKYGWLNVYSLSEPPYTEKDLAKLKKTVKQEEIEKTFSNIKKSKKEFSELIKKVKNKELRAKATLMHEYAFIKNDRVDAWKKALYYLQPFFQHLRDMFNDKDITLRTITNLTYDEIKQILLEGKLPDPKEIKKRNKPFIHYVYKDKMHIVTDSDEIEEIKRIVIKDVSGRKELKGSTASKGKAKGKAVIVKTLKDLKKVKKGNVLIARTTDPRYTPYMKKAVAIVADEGGMLSHAALTSRELGLPCIVGAKIATRVFKDGDLVEVDANKGVVKKIK